MRKDQSPLVTIGHLALVADDIDLLERLAQSDGHGNQLFVPNEKLVNALKSMGYAHTCNRDWIFGTERLRSALPKLKASLAALGGEG